MSDKQAAVIGEWLQNHEETTLSSFVDGQGTLVPCIFMRFSMNVQTSSCGFFVCLVFFPDETAFSS